MRDWSTLVDLTRRWSQWVRLSVADRRTLIGLAVALPLIDVAMRFAGLKRLQHWLLGRHHATRAISSNDVTAGHRLAALAAIAGAHGLYRITCLRQALLLQWMLRRRGVHGSLQIGALKTPEGTLDAHAWVELDGVALGQPNLAHSSFPGFDTTAH